MSIRLKYLLSKKGIELEKFCTQNGLTGYNLVVEYCKERSISCDVTEIEYKKAMPEVKKLEVPKNEKSKTEVKKTKSTPRRRSRKPKTSKAGAVDTKDNS